MPHKSRIAELFATCPGLVLLVVLTGCASTPRIEDRPIPFSSTRQEATLDYIAKHYDKHPPDITIEPRIVVLHWTAIPDLAGSFNAFEPERLPNSRPDLSAAGQVNVSIQFLVDRDGAIYRLMPEIWMARHTIGLNYNAIGVENVGGADSVDNMTDDQIEANIRLVRYLVEKYPSIEYLIGHSEYREFEGHSLWLELDDSYRTDKVDPGDRFMTAVRKAVAHLDLKGPEEIRAERLLE
ncbi:MAG: peptidoglycan recognition family protein [Thermoanaerobaculia bacterium]|jgi:N-acetyl-anhydromuramyl-L-alanine amidase AmpD